MAAVECSPFARLAASPLAAAFPATPPRVGAATDGGACLAPSASMPAQAQAQAQLVERSSLPAPARAGAPLCRQSLDALIAVASRKPGFGQPAVASAGPLAPPALAPPAAEVLRAFRARRVASGSAAGIADAAQQLIKEASLADTFYVYDLGEVARLHATWCAALPRVAPFYAVKCNPEPGVVAMLAALGAGFDCASIQELQLAVSHGVPQSRIIFANPCKRPADFRYAAEAGLTEAPTTFDCGSELEKIAAGYPGFKCVLRIRCDDASAKINLGLKYGADAGDVPALLAMAARLGLQVVGVSFHVGSGCQNVGVYADAIAAARQAFDIGASLGFPMNLLDIGGGFTAPHAPGVAPTLFHDTADVINAALDAHFPPGCGVRIIAEPGRYFAETSATLFTTILGQREAAAAHSAGGPSRRDYWLSDGTYGSFRIQVAVDGLEPTYSVLRSPLLPALPASAAQQPLLPCRLWGSSDRDGDVVAKAALLPLLRDGDWLMFPAAGAYTICAASHYGGARFTQPLKHFIYSSSAGSSSAGADAQSAQAADAPSASAASGAGPDDACLPAPVRPTGSDASSTSCCMDAEPGACAGQCGGDEARGAPGFKAAAGAAATAAAAVGAAGGMSVSLASDGSAAGLGCCMACGEEPEVSSMTC